MSAVSKALEEGYSPEEILTFLSNAYPKLGKKIKAATNSGYGVDAVLNVLSNVSAPKRSHQGLSQQATHAAKRLEDIQSNKNLLKSGLQAAALTGGGLLAGRALKNVPKLANLLGRGAVPPTPPQAASAPVAQTLETVAQVVPKPSSQNIKSELDTLKLTPKIESLLGRNRPEQIPAMLQKQISPEQIQQLESAIGKPFPEIIQDYANQYLQKAQEKPFSRESLNQQFQTAEGQREQEIQQEKEKLVALPDGKIGNLVEKKQGIASIRLPDGQVRRKSLSDVVEEPEGLENQITDLINNIPEDQRSAVLAFGSYNPGEEFTYEGKTYKIPMLGIQFHSGDFYLYPGVTQEQFNKILSKSVTAKTTGENPWHAWVAGKGSRGAGFAELKKELENEFGKNFIKFSAKGGYDYFRLIRQIVQKLEREKRRKV